MSKKGVLGFVLVIVFALFAFLAWAVSEGNKEGEAIQQITKQYSDAVIAGNYAATTSLVTPELSSSLTKSAFDSMTAKVKGATFVKWKDANYEFNALSVEVALPDGTTHTLAYQLAGEEGMYKISDVALDGKLKAIADAEKMEQEKAKLSAEQKAAQEKEENAGIKEVMISNEAIEFLGSYSATTFTKDSTPIYVGVRTKREDNLTVTVDLIAPTGEKVISVTGQPSGYYYVLGKGSSSGALFTITKPNNGWPLGTYKIVATSSKGDSKEATFLVK